MPMVNNTTTFTLSQPAYDAASVPNMGPMQAVNEGSLIINYNMSHKFIKKSQIHV